MARFGFCGPTYASQSPNADAERCINLYPEVVESENGKSRMVLYSTPGLKIFSTLPDSPGRGKFSINGRDFAVAGTSLYELFADATFVNRGTVGGSGMCSFASSPTQLLVASSGTLFVLNLTTNVFTSVNAGQGAISQVGYTDGYFVALIANSQKFQISKLLDATTWDGLNVAQVSLIPDNIISMTIDHREIWLQGLTKTVVYYDSGQADFPFTPNQSAYIEQGTIGSTASVRLDNSIFWWGQDERGALVAWRAVGYTPVRVSNHAVEFAVQGYTTASDVVTYAYQDQGHTFFVSYFPTANKTWVYDVATQMWHERNFLNANGSFTAHRSNSHSYCFGKHLVSDPLSGNIYQMAINLYDDFGNAIRRTRRAPHIATEAEVIPHNKLQIDLETGLGPQPPLAGPATESPSTVTMADANGVKWDVTINSAGALIANPSVSNGAAQIVILKDNGVVATTAWKLVIGTNGIFQSPVSVPLLASYPNGIRLISTSGLLAFMWGINSSGIMQQNNDVPPLFIRDPQIMLRWSDDACHTWSNEYLLNCGQAGKFKTRAIKRRLGCSRCRTYEISMTDPIPWRIIDAYYNEPTERIVTQARKSA